MGKKENVKNKMRELISNHEYPRQSRLPGVAKLCEHFDVSTATAVNAMKDLEAEGFVRAVHGDGYFVADVLPEPNLENVISTAVSELRKEATRLRAIADSLESAITAISDKLEPDHDR